MRGKFFLYLAVALIMMVVAYFVFMVLRAIYATAVEMYTARELDRLADEFTEKRRQQTIDAKERLDNGCDHLFDDAGGALPPDVCCKCGLAKSRPGGKCDHAWAVLPGIIPQSTCSKCGEKFTSVIGT